MHSIVFNLEQDLDLLHETKSIAKIVITFSPIGSFSLKTNTITKMIQNLVLRLILTEITTKFD